MSVSVSVAIHQPNFFPTLKIINKLVNSDKVVFLNDVQFVRNDIQNRIKLRNFQKPINEFWYSCSVKKGSSRKKINCVEVSDYKYLKDNFISTLYNLYRFSPYYNHILDYVNGVFSKEFVLISDFNIYAMKSLLDFLNIKKQYICSDTLSISDELTKDDRLIEIVKVVGGTEYISGLGGKNYINESKFIDNKIKLKWHKWVIPKGIEINNWNEISFLDFVARYGFNRFKDYLLYEGEIVEYL